MIDFDVDRCTRKCSRTEREFRPGETYFTALLPEGTGLKRLDFAHEAWTGPPEEAVAWWTAQMPGGSGRRAQTLSTDAAWEYFQVLEQDPAKADLRYVLALFLIRRRIARWEHTETDDQGQETMVLYCPRHEVELRVPVQMPSPARVREIEQEFSQMLGPPQGG